MIAFDLANILRVLIKAILEGLALALAVMLISRKSDWKEMLALGLTAAAVFIVLDMFVPLIGDSARLGAGVGVGLGLVGANVGMVPSAAAATA